MQIIATEEKYSHRIFQPVDFRIDTIYW